MDFAAVRAELAKGNRVLLLVRHAERRKIDQEDPTFGETVPITENGVGMSETFGREFRDFRADVQFRASPLRRTVMTAETIARGMGVQNPDIPQDDLIGNGSVFFEDRIAVWQLFRDKKFFEHMLDYMERGVLNGFAPVCEASKRYEEYVLSKFTAKFGVFATHDVFIAAYLYGMGVKTDWSADNWPRFLDAAAIVIEPDGTRRRALFRAGLSELAVGVA